MLGSFDFIKVYISLLRFNVNDVSSALLTVVLVCVRCTITLRVMCSFLYKVNDYCFVHDLNVMH